MQIGFLVNDVNTEKPRNTTVRLAMRASNMGHEVWLFGLADLSYQGHLTALARRAPVRTYREMRVYLEALRGERGIEHELDLATLDVLMLRSNPADDLAARPWAVSGGVMFGRLAAAQGVLVLNDAEGLSRAMNKVYLEAFPPEVRPRTLISRRREVIKAFAEAEAAPIILKPLAGSGGAGVFIVRPGEVGNINQMIDAVGRDGYIIAQEYLPAAAEGDTRLFLIDGAPLRRKGRYAAFRRTRAADDIRNNVRAGGEVTPATITPGMLAAVEAMRPRLQADGMFLVGVDFAGDKVMEINVYSPGGLGNAGRCAGVDFTAPVIEAVAARLEGESRMG